MINRPTKRHQLSKFYLRPIGLVAIVALAIVCLGAIRDQQSSHPTTVTTQNQCGLDDNSVCVTLSLAKNDVRNKDFADILELQQPLSVTCPDPTYANTYCQGINSGIHLQLFDAIVHGQDQTFTRNHYITFFQSYFNQSGPFVLGATAQHGTTAQLDYHNPAGTAQYELNFTKVSGRWLILHPNI